MCAAPESIRTVTRRLFRGYSSAAKIILSLRDPTAEGQLGNPVRAEIVIERNATLLPRHAVAASRGARYVIRGYRVGAWPEAASFRRYSWQAMQLAVRLFQVKAAPSRFFASAISPSRVESRRNSRRKCW